MTVIEDRMPRAVVGNVSDDAVRQTQPVPATRPSLGERTRYFEMRVVGWLDRHSITALRISMGAVIFAFGILKFFPGVSPAEGLVLQMANLLTFGFLPERVVMVLLAGVECAIGLSLITRRGLRVAVYLIALWVLGILSPAVLMFAELFSGPNHAPTLTGQYVLKDIVFLAALLVIATTVLRHPEDH